MKIRTLSLFVLIIFWSLLALAESAVPSKATLGLRRAAINGNIQSTREHLSKNANPDYQEGKKGFSSLHIAVINGYREIVKSILTSKPDIDLKTKHGLTPVMLAILKNRPQILKDLVKAGANLDIAAPKHHNTPLILTAIFNRIEMGKVLMNGGCSVFKQTKYGTDAYLIAKEKGHIEFAKMIKKAVPVKYFNKWLKIFPIAGVQFLDFVPWSYYDHNPTKSELPSRLSKKKRDAMLKKLDSYMNNASYNEFFKSIYKPNSKKSDYILQSGLSEAKKSKARLIFIWSGVRKYRELDIRNPKVLLDFRGSTKSYDGHQGIDYGMYKEAQDIGIPVVAAADGRVSRAGFLENPNEETVWIDHNYSRQTYYNHLKKTTVKKGQYVYAGEQIGWAGGLHLHFSIKEWGEWVDPYSGPGNKTKSRWAKQPIHVHDAPVSVINNGLIDSTKGMGWRNKIERRNYYRVGEKKIWIWLMVLNAKKGKSIDWAFYDPKGKVFNKYSDNYLNPKPEQRSRDVGLEYLKLYPGKWRVEVSHDNAILKRFNLQVIGGKGEFPKNRSPKKLKGIELTVIRRSKYPVFSCRIKKQVENPDPDNDLPYYIYSWKLNQKDVRTVMSATHLDYFNGKNTEKGDRITCSVSVSDSKMKSPAIKETIEL